MAKTKDDSLAQERTKWAEDRTIMANERTFSSWMGTGLGAIGVSIGFQAVFREFEPTWLAKGTATIFLIIAVMIFWSAHRNACKTFERLKERDVQATQAQSYTILASVMSIAAIGTGIVLWFL